MAAESINWTVEESSTANAEDVPGAVRLAVRVLEQAVEDLKFNDPSAREFFLGDETLLHLWCGLAGVDPDIVREALAKYLAPDLKLGERTRVYCRDCGAGRLVRKESVPEQARHLCGECLSRKFPKVA